MRPDGTADAVVRFPPRTLGRWVLRVAGAAGGAAVIARFERSAYVRDADGNLACLGGDTLGFGPLNAVLAAGEFERADLRCGDRVELDVGAATLWRPPQLPIRCDARQALAVLDGALARVPPRGLAAATAGDPAHPRARAGLTALTAWIGTGDGEPPAAVAELLGLGPGLTPAGDDALGGAMIALRAFGAADTADRLASCVLPLAGARTGEISRAHLGAAADGEGAAALHDTLFASAAADPVAAVAGLQRLDRIGHSSGWDALAGVIAALRGLS